MRCPTCGCTRSKLVQTRVLEIQHYRRRMCTECGERFNTVETFTHLRVPSTGSKRARMPKVRPPTPEQIQAAIRTHEQDHLELIERHGSPPAPDPHAGTEDWRTTFERRLRRGRDR